MKDTTSLYKSDSDSQTLAQETKVIISRIKKHLESENCDHCKRVLNGDNNDD